VHKVLRMQKGECRRADQAENVEDWTGTLRAMFRVYTSWTDPGGQTWDTVVISACIIA